MNKMGGMCLNWKVIAGLAVVGLGIWAVAPNVVWAALPLLLFLACPISMLLMMRGMQGGQCATQGGQVRSSTGVGLTRDEQLAELKAQLARAQAQRETIDREIARLEAAKEPAVGETQAGRRTTSDPVNGRL
jgi:hypothetical protein